MIILIVFKSVCFLYAFYVYVGGFYLSHYLCNHQSLNLTMLLYHSLTQTETQIDCVLI